MNTKTLERRVADDLANSFERTPHLWAWRNADCDMVLGPGGLVMSARFFTVYQPTTLHFGFWNRWRIRRALKRWRKAAGNDLAVQERHKALLVVAA